MPLFREFFYAMDCVFKIEYEEVGKCFLEYF